MPSRFIRGRITELTLIESGAPDCAAHTQGVMMAPVSNCHHMVKPAVSWVPGSVLLSGWGRAATLTRLQDLPIGQMRHPSVVWLS